MSLEKKIYSNEAKLEILDKVIQEGLGLDPMFVNHALYALKLYIQPKLGMDGKIKSYNYERDWLTSIDIGFAKYKLKENEKIN